MSDSAVTRAPAVLVLEDGRCFEGQAFGATGVALGEAVFCTAMTGYQETLTDPSYHRQVVVQTTPHIGNTGINDDDAESGQIWVSGYVVRDPSPVASSWRATRSLEDELHRFGVVGICGVDTRALTRHLRTHGAMRVGISSDGGHPPELLDAVLGSPSMRGADLTAEVTTREAYVVPAVGAAQLRVAAVDLGIKAMTPRLLAQRDVEVHVLPATTSMADLTGRGFDGVFLSNGPGDPAAADGTVALVRAVLDAGLPIFGICFGHQVFGRALGLRTYKLGFGHRGINQPVHNLRSGRVEISAHNHGFAVDAPTDRPIDTPYGRVEVSHVCLNDGVVEGLKLLDRPGFSVQYHPEAAAGPHDSAGLFDEFVALMTHAKSGGRR